MKPPVFILGSPRSGTTLLYHMLLSSGGFAVYLTESNVFNFLIPRFGDLSLLQNKKKLLKAWLQSKLFRATGLTSGDIEAKILAECRNGGDFLRIVMEEIAYHQHVDRWADCTPAHLLYIEQIKQAFPNALIIHIIRDGRDVALSLERIGWMGAFPWQAKHSRLIAGLYWERTVKKGRQYGQMIAPDYTEVRFEELVLDPGNTLAKLGEFIKEDLKYDKIYEIAIGAVRRPNTSFESELENSPFRPVGRWKLGFTRDELIRLEFLIGDLLDELHYPRGAVSGSVGSCGLRSIRALYRGYFDSTLWVKQKTPLARYVMRSDLSWV